MEYLSNYRGCNCWTSGPPINCLFSHMSRKWMNVMILIVFFLLFSFNTLCIFNVVQNGVHFL